MGAALGGGGSAGTRRRRRRSGAPMSEINVTPLVDVMLVLLIIFMVTAPLLAAGVPIDLPDSAAAPLDQPDEEPVQISIDADGGVFIGEERIAMDALPDRLAQIAAAQGEEPRQILLRGDRGLDYGLVMRVMGELSAAGLTSVSLVTVSSSGTE